jgi:hypothetical protein
MEKSVERLSKVADVDLISLKNSLVKDQRVADLNIVVKDKIASLPPNVSYKNNTELILYVCKLVENVVSKKDGLNKKDLVISILKPLLGLNDAEVKLTGEIIEFLHSNGLIQRIKQVKKIKSSIVSWFKKKVC